MYRLSKNFATDSDFFYYIIFLYFLLSSISRFSHLIIDRLSVLCLTHGGINYKRLLLAIYKRGDKPIKIMQLLTTTNDTDPKANWQRACQTRALPSIYAVHYLIEFLGHWSQCWRTRNTDIRRKFYKKPDVFRQSDH